jgi:hypothetical protein
MAMSFLSEVGRGTRMACKLGFLMLGPQYSRQQWTSEHGITIPFTAQEQVTRAIKLSPFLLLNALDERG